MSKAERVASEIRQLIHARTFSDDRLPSEPDLARLMGASRATLRQALASLERDGLILRKHGSGTFINQNVKEMRTRLEEVWDFDEMIRLAGYDAGVRHLQMGLSEAAAGQASCLRLDPGEEILTTANVFLANNEPVIYCIDIIPARLVNRAYRDEELHGPVYTFLESRCGQRIDYTITDVWPVTADEKLAGLLECEIGAPLHYFEELGFNADHLPIIYSEEYYRPEYFNFKVVRKMTTSRSERAG